MSMERKLIFVAGAIVLASVLLAVYQNQNWLWLTGFAGAHMMFTSATNMCPLVRFLTRNSKPELN
ncbi:DUF2892 domain-containing protein [Roseibium sp.]|uniref:YgaP family membrane protein n=1 Tax=Roseibium sp. TaxID=1936156 RepID=UPI00326679CA